MDTQVNLTQPSLSDKITSIKQAVRSLELRLSGYEWDSDGNKFIYTGNALAGRNVIAKATGLLQPFCEESNLITIKQFEMWSRQKWEINSTLNETLLAEMGCPAVNYKVILKMFKSTLQNIGDIILGSKDFMKGFTHTEEEKDIGGL